jgi:iron complex transport system permease protein
MSGTEGYLTPGRFGRVLGAWLTLWLLAGLACMFFGQESIRAGKVLAVLAGGAGRHERAIVLGLRLPRVLLGLLVGGGLAMTGAAFQALLRNPLATPHTLGVSAGGALGAALAITLDWEGPSIGPVGTIQFFALAGALVNVFIVYSLARRRRLFSPLRLLLAGVTLGLICSALIMFVQFAGAPDELVEVHRWLMGGLQVSSFRSLAAVFPVFLPAGVLLLVEANAMNQIALGEEMAAGRGVAVKAAQVRCFIAGSVLTAVLVSVAGPIGFVGLIVPHLLRALFGPDHRLLLLLCFFGGGIFLVVADTVARVTFAPSELPVGVLTAMLGGPFFLVLLVRKVS